LNNSKNSPFYFLTNLPLTISNLYGYKRESFIESIDNDTNLVLQKVVTDTSGKPVTDDNGIYVVNNDTEPVELSKSDFNNTVIETNIVDTVTKNEVIASYTVSNETTTTYAPTYETTYAPTYETTYAPTYETTYAPTYETTYAPTYETTYQSPTNYAPTTTYAPTTSYAPTTYTATYETTTYEPTTYTTTYETTTYAPTTTDIYSKTKIDTAGYYQQTQPVIKPSDKSINPNIFFNNFSKDNNSIHKFSRDFTPMNVNFVKF
jgi:hypothetical protein